MTIITHCTNRGWEQCGLALLFMGKQKIQREIGVKIDALVHALKLQLMFRLFSAGGAKPFVIGTSGGTVPISPFIQALGFPVINAPAANSDNNQDGEDENLRMGHFWKAIATIGALLRLDVSQDSK